MNRHHQSDLGSWRGGEARDWSIETEPQPTAFLQGSNTDTRTLTANEESLAAYNSSTHTATPADLHLNASPTTLVQNTINKLEKPKLTPPETYIMCKATPFEKFPSVTLKIIDKDNTFLADSGATHSVIRAKELPHSVVELDFILGVAIG